MLKFLGNCLTNWIKFWTLILWKPAKQTSYRRCLKPEVESEFPDFDKKPCTLCCHGNYITEEKDMELTDKRNLIIVEKDKRNKKHLHFCD